MNALQVVLLIIAIFIAAVVIRCFYELYHFEITEYEIKSEKLTANSKLVFLSDLHSRSYGDQNKKLIDAISGIAPDVILLGGDMINGAEGSVNYFKMDETRKFIKKLTDIAPVYYAYGNHEEWFNAAGSLEAKSEFIKYKESLELDGVHFLENKSAVLNMCSGVEVRGISIARPYYYKFIKREAPEGYIKKLIGTLDNSRFNIILAHTPMFFNDYNESGADLILCGHYHGGAVNIPGLGGVINPQFMLFPKYYAGLYKDNTTMIVSRGIGSHTVNLRFNNKPEVLVLNLKK